MKYDPIMCMMVDDSVKTKDAMFVQLRFSSGRTEGAKLEENEYREYAEALLNKYGEKMVTISKNGKAIATYMNRSKLFKDSNTIDKAIKMCDYAYGTAEIKDVNGKWVVYHSGKYVQEFDNSDDAEAFVREKGWH